jgi:hypothetical protein
MKAKEIFQVVAISVVTLVVVLLVLNGIRELSIDTARAIIH